MPVPINPRYRAEDFRFFVQDSGARVMIVDDEYLPALETALGELRTAAQVIATGSAHGADHHLPALLAAADPDLAPADTHQDDMAFWLYSSGSTGNPKGVVHLHRNVPYTCDTYARHILEIRESDIVYGRVLYHAYGLGNTLTFPFSVGATTILDSSRPSPAGVLEAGEPPSPDAALSGADALQRDPQPPRPRRRGPVLRTSLHLRGRAAATGDAAALAGTLRPDDLDGIGSTEMLHIFCSNSADEVRPGSSGKPVPGYELRIVDEAGDAVSDGETGTLLVKGGSAAPGEFVWADVLTSDARPEGAPLSALVVRLIAAIDGRRSVREVLVAVAEGSGASRIDEGVSAALAALQILYLDGTVAGMETAGPSGPDSG